MGPLAVLLHGVSILVTLAAITENLKTAAQDRQMELKRKKAKLQNTMRNTSASGLTVQTPAEGPAPGGSLTRPGPPPVSTVLSKSDLEVFKAAVNR